MFVILKSSDEVKTKDIKSKLGNGIIASDSCVTAIYFGLKYVSQGLDVMLNHIFKLGVMQIPLELWQVPFGGLQMVMMN